MGRLRRNTFQLSAAMVLVPVVLVVVVARGIPILHSTVHLDRLPPAVSGFAVLYVNGHPYVDGLGDVVSDPGSYLGPTWCLDCLLFLSQSGCVCL